MITGEQNIHFPNEIESHSPTNKSFSHNASTTDRNMQQIAGLTTETTPPFLEISNLTAFNKHYERLNVEQRKVATFLREWKGDTHLLIVSGAAGTGKSFSTVNSLKYFKGTFFKLALTNQVARSINGRTIHSKLKINYKSMEPHSFGDIDARMKRNELTMDVSTYVAECYNVADELIKHVYPSRIVSPSIVLIDEVSLIPFWFIISVMKYYTPALFIMLGDEFQLRPVNCPYNIFSFPISIPTTTIRLSLNNRFTPEYNQLIEQMRILVTEQKTDEMITFLKTHFPVKERILEHDLDNISFVLAYKNETVKMFNTKFLDRLEGPYIRIPVISNDKKVLQHNALLLKFGCRVVTTRDTVFMLQGEETCFNAYMPESDSVELMNGFILKRNPYDHQFPIQPAYSFTMHKFQGRTIDESGILFHFDGHAENLNLVYTALSRVRNKSQIYGIVL